MDIITPRRRTRYRCGG